MLTSLCYIEQDDKYLMLHRTKKAHDPNHAKWLGIGGKFERDESPEECMLREVYEETGLRLTEYRFRGIITFASSDWPETEYMHLFTAGAFEGQLKECSEGELAWIPRTQVFGLNLWEGDRVFLELLETRQDFFSLKLCYEGDRLINSVLFT